MHFYVPNECLGIQNACSFLLTSAAVSPEEICRCVSTIPIPDSFVSPILFCSELHCELSQGLAAWAWAGRSPCMNRSILQWIKWDMKGVPNAMTPLIMVGVQEAALSSSRPLPVMFMFLLSHANARV